MIPALLIGGSIVGVIALSRWLRRLDESGYPSRRSEGEEHHPESGPHFRPLESPPSEPFD